MGSMDVEEADALELLRAAYERRINTWDTADAYSNGISEDIIGKAIRRFNIPREKLVIMTKCFQYVGEEPRFHPMVYWDKVSKSKDYVNRGGEYNLLSDVSVGSIGKDINR
jgi:aryl-alcohol dehydrogenase-like predicted oxidoreductase